MGTGWEQLSLPFSSGGFTGCVHAMKKTFPDASETALPGAAGLAAAAQPRHASPSPSRPKRSHPGGDLGEDASRAGRTMEPLGAKDSPGVGGPSQ